jgi:hypothetical protein
MTLLEIIHRRLLRDPPSRDRYSSSLKEVGITTFGTPSGVIVIESTDRPHFRYRCIDGVIFRHDGGDHGDEDSENP